MARTAAGADRSDPYRLPGLPKGLVHAGLVRPGKPEDFDDQLRWMREVLEPLLDEQDEY